MRILHIIVPCTFSSPPWFHSVPTIKHPVTIWAYLCILCTFLFPYYSSLACALQISPCSTGSSLFSVSFHHCYLHMQVCWHHSLCFKYVSGLLVSLQSSPSCQDAFSMPPVPCPHLHAHAILRVHWRTFRAPNIHSWAWCLSVFPLRIFMGWELVKLMLWQVKTIVKFFGLKESMHKTILTDSLQFCHSSGTTPFALIWGPERLAAGYSWRCYWFSSILEPKLMELLVGVTWHFLMAFSSCN